MLKKIVLMLMASMLVFSFSVPMLVEAKTSFKAPRKSFTPAVQHKTSPHDVSKHEPAGTTTRTPGVTSPNAKPGFFSGGLMKGLLLGGLAGLLFGGLFGGMGALGHMLGLFVNILAIVLLFVLIKKVAAYFYQRRKMNQDPERY
ncbi:hypothetical protein ACFQZT_22085 [Paenibacillus sp. GCM10027628]|uniref:hypothetical protein n=1 Tax=Paenibacillus sp. GCM10027628 TaxID=3273413 RepID=UPI0036436290